MSLNQKLALIMSKVSRVPKNGWNDHFKYQFATDADVSDLVRTLLAEAGIAFLASMTHVEQITWMEETTYKNSGNTVTKQRCKSRCTFEYTFICVDTGDSRTCTWVGEADDDQDKGISKAATSALKYFLLKTFMISTGNMADDPDADLDKLKGEEKAESGKTPPQREAPARPKTKPADLLTADLDMGGGEKKTDATTAPLTRYPQALIAELKAAIAAETNMSKQPLGKGPRVTHLGKQMGIVFNSDESARKAFLKDVCGRTIEHTEEITGSEWFVLNAWATDDRAKAEATLYKGELLKRNRVVESNDKAAAAVAAAGK